MKTSAGALSLGACYIDCCVVSGITRRRDGRHVLSVGLLVVATVVTAGTTGTVGTGTAVATVATRTRTIGTRTTVATVVAIATGTGTTIATTLATLVITLGLVLKGTHRQRMESAGSSRNGYLDPTHAQGILQHVARQVLRSVAVRLTRDRLFFKQL